MTTTRASEASHGVEDLFSFPLSFAQRRLWFLQKLEPGSAYNVPLALRLRGELDVDSLERALSEIVARHESLRTTFAETDGVPYQLVHAARPEVLELDDLSGDPDPETEMRRLFAEQALQAFDLAAAPPRRALLMRLGREHHVLAMTFHHIVCDGWSLNVFARELGALYGEFAGGPPARLPDLPIQYPDYAVSQQEWTGGDVLRQQLDYWRAKLDGAPTALELPTDRPRRAVAKPTGGHLVTTLPRPLLRDLTALSRDEGATLFMTLLAAFQVVLARYSGQPEFLVGTPIANRHRVELEDLIGFLTNTLVIRSAVPSSATFREVLTDVRTTVLEAQAHQDLPFELLVEELNPPRERSRTPLVQVMFSVHLGPSSADVIELPGLTIATVPLERATSKFDLSLFMRETTDGLRATFEYNTELFDRSTIERLAGHFATLLNALATDPDRPVSELPLLTASERSQLVDEWNDTTRPFPSDCCVHEVFRSQAQREPDAISLVAGSKRFSYAELDAEANRLAQRLRRLGVGPDVMVGICLERSADLVVSLLATLKAGGAYVPLDPEYPTARLAFMLEDTAAPVLITETRLLERLPPVAGSVICLDRDAEEIASEPSADPEVAVEPENLAYVMYTSGSTGMPKGVMIEHRAICRLVKGSDYASFGPDEIFLQLAPVSFDASTFEIWGALLNGGRLVVFPPERPTAASLAEVLKREGVTTLWLTAALFHHIVAEAPAAFSGLRQLLAGGDVLAAEHVRSAVLALSGGRFVNGYGPTEATTFSCCYTAPEASEVPESVPIGRPITNTEVYVLDANRQLVPIGIPGELYIGGPGLARGYLNRPELTAERFVRVSAGGASVRLYRTGDLVRYRPDGNIEFLGRLDDQLKLRGYRVEPGEVEAALLAHPDVSQAVVVARHVSDADVRLVAYYAGGAHTGSELRAFLAESLPDYMLPAGFVRLDALPRTPNGKVDRRALPAPDYERPELDESYVAPVTDTEQVLAELFARVLKLERVGREDDFFELGGHSLLAVELFAAIERVFRVKLPLTVLFQAATVSHVAGALRQHQEEMSQWPSIVPLRPGTKPLPLYLVHGDDGELLIYRELVRNIDPDQPVYGIQGVGLDRRRLPYTNFEDMAADHVEELLRFQPDGPFLLCGYCYSGVLAYEVARQLQGAGRQIAFLGLVDAFPFGHGIRRTRKELERLKFADFRGRDLRGKVAWIRRRLSGLVYKIKTRTRWALFDWFVRRGASVPGFLWDMQSVGLRAARQYVAPVTSSKVMLFRAAVDGRQEDSGSLAVWGALAQGGADVRWIEGDGVRHDNIVHEPHVRTLAAELTHAIDDAVESSDDRAKVGAVPL